MRANQELLCQLLEFLTLLTQEQYTQPLNTLQKQSIGKHIRHIIEFYEHLLQGYRTLGQSIDYDLRPRSLQTETDKHVAGRLLADISTQLAGEPPDCQMVLNFSIDPSGTKQVIDTTFYRELAYLMEHAIHHLAIMKCALLVHFPHLVMPPQLGVAYATQQFQQQNSQTHDAQM